MAVTQVTLPTRFSPLHMPIACMFVNAVSKMTTPRGINTPANGTPLVSGGDKLAIRTAYPRQGSKFIFGFGSTCATRCKFLGALQKF